MEKHEDSLGFALERLSVSKSMGIFLEILIGEL
jgi:hypothetical protein